MFFEYCLELYLVKKQNYQLKLLKKEKIYNIFEVLLLK